MPILIHLGKSQRQEKKYVASFRNPKKTIHFGQKGAEDYTIHGDEKRKENYIARHKAKENWEDPLTAGSLSYHLLWNKPTLEESLKDYLNKFGIKDNRGKRPV